MTVTPATIEATWAMVESARAASELAPQTKASGTDLWAYEYAQDVPPLLTEVERLEAALAYERARFASLAQDHSRLERIAALADPP